MELNNSDNALKTMMAEPGSNKKEAIRIIEAPIDKRHIKYRDTGYNKKLAYIGGSTVVRLLNEAFGYTWSFEIINKEIIESLPKTVTKWVNRKKVVVKNADGSPKLDPQAPYVEILGRLTIPGIGIKEQYGTKIILGGASEQEGASKAAATDALKKCATLVGVGLELYEDESFETPKPEKKQNQKSSYNNNPPTQKKEEDPWKGKENETKRLVELKALLGIKDNTDLNPFVQEWLQDKTVTWEYITPKNIKGFNAFLQEKLEGMSGM